MVAITLGRVTPDLISLVLLASIRCLGATMRR